MTGKLAAFVILLCAVVAGGALYYLQIYAYYREVVPTPGSDVLLMSQATQTAEPIAYGDFQAIDADSSPIRYRACFTTPLGLDELRLNYIEAPDMAPRNAPGWFDCFDAAALGAELEAGTAATFMGAKNVAYGVDRIVAITADGRGFSWHELNECGEKDYDGTVVGETCPPRPGADPGN